MSQVLYENYHYSITSFYGGQDREKCIQITDQSGTGYIQIPLSIVNLLVKQLKQTLILEKGKE